MGAVAADIHREVEFKFRVPLDFDVESVLTGESSFLTGGFSVDIEQPRNMSAIYFDTPTASLLRWGITLRNRSGGADDGWHLKLPIFGEKVIKGATKRLELHASGDSELPPADFIAVVGILLRDADVNPIARVNTERQPYTIARKSDDGRNAVPLLEVVDDHVHVYQGDNLVDSFREIEVELIDNEATELASKLSENLLTAGAAPSSVSKAAAAFGPVVTQQPDVPLLPQPKKSALPYEIVRWAITQQVLAVIQAELSSHLQDSTSELLNQLQRLAALLQSLANFLDPAESAELLAEVNWLISEFTSTHHIDQERHIALNATECIDDPLDRHEAQLAIDSFFERKSVAAQSSARAAQRSDRYLYLFSDLMDFARVPPVSDTAFAQQKLWRNIDPATAHIAAEILAPIFPKKSAKILRGPSIASKQKTTSVQELLRAIATDPATPAAGAFGLGTAVGLISVSGDQHV